eukprot:3750545-Prymnesium_polylepis.1
MAAAAAAAATARTRTCARTCWQTTMRSSTRRGRGSTGARGGRGWWWCPRAERRSRGACPRPLCVEGRRAAHLWVAHGATEGATKRRLRACRQRAGDKRTRAARENGACDGATEIVDLLITVRPPIPGGRRPLNC